MPLDHPNLLRENAPDPAAHGFPGASAPQLQSR